MTARASGPCIFTAIAPHGGLLLAYLIEEFTDDSLRYLVSTTTDAVIESLKSGTTTVREALTMGWAWLCDVSFVDRKVLRVYAPPLEQLPEDALPMNGTMLWPELEPALRVRLIGSHVREGAMPARVFEQISEIAKSLKTVFEYAARELLNTTGRPPEWIRSLYSLSAQRLAYGSLEVSFQQVRPQDQLEIPDGSSHRTVDDIVNEGWELLSRGLDWLASESYDLGAHDEAERRAILEALRRLSPNATGPVEVIEISGARVGGHQQVRRIDRKSSKRVRDRLASLSSPVALEVFSGRVRDLDLDKLEFVLRNIIGQKDDSELTFVIDDEQHLETAREAHYREVLVKVAAKRPSGTRWQVVDIEFAESASEAANQTP